MKLNKLLESVDNNRKIAIFAGRFQPFHQGHFQMYKHLIEKFGFENVFIASSNKQSDVSPFSFADKQEIANKIFGIPNEKFVYTPQPYRPDRILDNYNHSKTIVIFALSEKDSDRFSSPFMKPYHKNAKNTYDNNAYIYTVPTFANGISATSIRDGFRNATDKEEFITNIYGKIDDDVMNIFLDKL